MFGFDSYLKKLEEEFASLSDEDLKRFELYAEAREDARLGRFCSRNDEEAENIQSFPTNNLNDSVKSCLSWIRWGKSSSSSEDSTGANLMSKLASPPTACGEGNIYTSYGMPPPQGYQRNVIGISNGPGSLGTSSLLGCRSSSGRRGLGPTSRGNDSGLSSRTGTPPNFSPRPCQIVSLVISPITFHYI